MQNPRRAVVAGLGILGAIGLVAVVLHERGNAGPQTVSAVAERAAEQLRAAPVSGINVSSFEVEEALAEAARGSRVRISVRAAGDHQFEVTNPSGGSPACLVVVVDSAALLRSTEPVFPSVTVLDGRCPAG
ncbi:hypothetical protein BJY16_009099 [Actinoplanes octamycinicus]|uniref:Uncharacterized protein n=1 Tax=Actinoplanes octamycinicus TaxID=135948 RepID=A0A7W7H7Y0_9ACTN|nr:hypothetical protein [Actinoplanes octamycinicus]MBB4745640.1 hypothetical protein [Actinoplanes octamycinicus]GIE56483.1 hypothetical protein Aoc01nite_18850 [Actinoplanes octamycinicus]